MSRTFEFYRDEEDLDRDAEERQRYLEEERQYYLQQERLFAGEEPISEEEFFNNILEDERDLFSDPFDEDDTTV